MSVSDKIVLFILVAVMGSALLFVKKSEGQTAPDYQLLDWAVIECGQGNPSACQLEKNLLKSQ